MTNVHGLPSIAVADDDDEDVVTHVKPLDEVETQARASRRRSGASICRRGCRACRPRSPSSRPSRRRRRPPPPRAEPAEDEEEIQTMDDADVETVEDDARARGGAGRRGARPAGRARRRARRGARRPRRERPRAPGGAVRARARGAGARRAGKGAHRALPARDRRADRVARRRRGRGGQGVRQGAAVGRDAQAEPVGDPPRVRAARAVAEPAEAARRRDPLRQDARGEGRAATSRRASCSRIASTIRPARSTASTAPSRPRRRRCRRGWRSRRFTRGRAISGSWRASGAAWPTPPPSRRARWRCCIDLGAAAGVDRRHARARRAPSCRRRSPSAPTATACSTSSSASPRRAAGKDELLRGARRARAAADRAAGGAADRAPAARERAAGGAAPPPGACWRASKGDGEGAWSYLQAALAASPGEPLIVRELSELAESLGRWDELADLYAGRVEAAPRVAQDRAQARARRGAAPRRQGGGGGRRRERGGARRAGAPRAAGRARARRRWRRATGRSWRRCTAAEAELANSDGTPTGKADPEWAATALVQAAAAYEHLGREAEAHKALEEARTPGAAVRPAIDALERLYARTRQARRVRGAHSRASWRSAVAGARPSGCSSI